MKKTSQRQEKITRWLYRNWRSVVCALVITTHFSNLSPRVHTYPEIFVCAFFFRIINIRVHTWRTPIVFKSFSLSTPIRIQSIAHCFWQRFCLSSMPRIVCWRHFLCFVNQLHVRVFRYTMLIYQSHPGKTGSDSVTSAYSKICRKFAAYSKFCGYDRPHLSEFAAYSKISTLEPVFENFGIRLPNRPFPSSCLPPL